MNRKNKKFHFLTSKLFIYTFCILYKDEIWWQEKEKFVKLSRLLLSTNEILMLCMNKYYNFVLFKLYILPHNKSNQKFKSFFQK